VVNFPNPEDLKDKKPKVLDQFNMTKNERLELNQLSKEVYGSTSKWQKMVNKGERVPQVEKMEDGTDRKYMGMSYYSVEEIKKTMLELKAEQDADEDNKLKEEQEKALNEMVSESEKLDLYEQDEKEIKLAIQEETKHDTIKEILETVGD
jgi:hypothetical protein